MTAAVICTVLLTTLVFGLGMNVSRVRSRSTNQLPTQLDRAQLTIALPGQTTIRASTLNPSTSSLSPGAAITLTVAPEDVVILPDD